MYVLVLILFLGLIQVNVSMGETTGITARFSWLPNPEETVTGYTLYYATVSGNYDKEHSVAVDDPAPIDGRIYGEISNLSEGTTYYFVVTAHDAQGLESNYSAEIKWTATSSTSLKPPSPRVLSIRTIN